jgi:hypothetical protein
MISVFQVFKIILGIIISVFILFLVLRFAGSYMMIGETSREVSVIVNFKKSISNVYTTGVPTDFEIKDSEILGYRPPYIETGVSFVDMDPIPFLTMPGEKFSIYRNEYDSGWWKFYFIEAFPETRVLFIPLGDDEKVWSIMGNITRFFPSTENTATNTKIGLGCEGSDFWFGWERQRFLDKIIPSLMTTDIDFEVCGNLDYFKKEGYKIITISEESMDADFLVKPIDNEIGYVYIKNGIDKEEYIYKNGLDIVALLLGGKKYYDYINEKFLKELEVGIDIGIKEVEFLRTDQSFRSRCGTEFSKFAGNLNLLKELIPEMDSTKEDDLREFAMYMKGSFENYKTLEKLGCG